MANEQNLIPAKKGEVRNPNGRPKKVDTILKEIFLDEYNVKLSKSQTEEIIKGVLSRTRSELMELAQNDDLPFWISMIANKATKDYKKGSIHLLELLFDRVYGKPKETVDQNIEAKTINVTLNLENPKGK
jgi:hypothetical protein|tara:strand:- start:45 stop:434 length:390 start_codon:yes stop_codon:yes gene_type:complete